MTGFLGADTDALRAIEADFTRCASQINDLATRLASVVDSVDWIGPDAEEFRERWRSQVHPRIAEGGSDLRRRGAELQRQAEEQDQTSSGDQAGVASLIGQAITTFATAVLGPAGAAAGAAIGALGAMVGSETPPSDAPSGAPADAPSGAPVPAPAIQLAAFSAPLAAARAAEVSEKIGTGELKFDDTGMVLTPPETDHSVTVGADHDLAPRSDRAPFGMDENGKQIDLDPSTTYTVKDRGTFYTDAEGRITYVEATGGGKEMNPNLREVLPDVTYHVNESTYYQTDELGRTEHMYVEDVQVDRDMKRSQSIQSKIAERFDMTTPEGTEEISFNAGHVLARQLGGIREEINYTRQWDEVNQARDGKDTIYTYESLMADGVGEGKNYSYETRVNWGDKQPPGVGKGSEPWEYVPESYDVHITEDGREIVDAHLPNYPDDATFARREESS